MASATKPHCPPDNRPVQDNCDCDVPSSTTEEDEDDENLFAKLDSHRGDQDGDPRTPHSMATSPKHYKHHR